MAESPGRGPSWKHRKDNAAAQAGRRSWQHGGERAKDVDVGGSKRSRRLRNRILGGLAVIAVVGVITWIAYQLGGTSPLTVVVFAYSEPTALNQPLNVANARAGEELVSWCNEDAKGERRRAVQPTANEWKNPAGTGASWITWLIQQGKSSGDTVLYYFGMPGHTDADKGPYLWVIPPDAAAPQPAHRLYVSDLLDHIQSDLSKKQRKVLVFDCTQVSSSWLHGMVRNDFARGLKELEKKIAGIPNCVAVCASGDDQRSWVSPERGMSIFGHYFVHGVRGGLRGTDTRPRISLKDVQQYAEERVEKWSLANRGAPQKPFVLPAGMEKLTDDIEVSTVSGTTPPEAEPQKRDELVGVSEAWKGYYALAREAAPETVAPHDWKRYTELLLRLEQLVWHGAPAKDTADVKDALAKAAKDIRNAQVPLVSSDLLITDLYTANPQDLVKDAKVQDVPGLLLEIWKNEEPAILAEPLGKWNALKDRIKDDVTLRQKVLIFGWRWVIDQYQRETDARAAERVCRLLEETFRPGTRPADVHFLRMLYRDSQEGPWAQVLGQQDLLKRQIALRSRAEQTAWRGAGLVGPQAVTHLAHVYRWMQPTVEDADEHRRKSEDLLFDAHPESWTRAEGEQAEADKLYTRAGQLAKAILEAEHLRDRAFAQLPYYSRWLAESRDAALEGAALDRLVALLEATWTHAHRIAAQLATPPAAANVQEPDTTELKKGLSEIDKELRRLVGLRVGAGGEGQASTWHTLESMLVTPFFHEALDAPDDEQRVTQAVRSRAAILQKLKDSSFILARDWQQPEKIGAAPVPFKSDEQARRQLRLSLACFGTDAIQDVKKAQVPAGDLAWSAERRIGQDPVENSRLADKLGQHWASLPAVLAGQRHDEAKAAQEALGASGSMESVPLAERWFSRAAQLSRQLDAGTRQPLDKVNQMTALQVDNWFRVHRYLLWQAQRTLAEGWANLAVGTKPYCVHTAEGQADLARTVLSELTKEKSPTPPKKGWYAALDDLTSRLKPPQLTMELKGLSAPTKLNVTDEELIKLRYEVGQRDIKGFPVVRLWSTTRGSGSSNTMLRLKKDEFTGHPHYFSHIKLAEAVTFVSPLVQTAAVALTPPEAQLRSMVLYRGHYFQDDTTVVSFNTTPTLRWIRTPAQEKPGLVVFGDVGAYDGHVHILFDVTLSMNEALAGSQPIKIEAARESLRQVLHDLPQGVQLSIALFCGIDERPTYSKDHDTASTLIYGPKSWNRATDLETVLRRIPDGKEAVEKIAGTRTPLVQAIEETVVPVGPHPVLQLENNPRVTLLVITDGVDTVTKKHTAEAIKDALLKSRSDIELHVLLFALSSKELKDDAIRTRLADLKNLNDGYIRSEFLRAERTPPRLWPDISDVKTLVDQLTNALRPRVTVIRSGEILTSDLKVTLDREAYWNQYHPPEPGSFTIKTAATRRAAQLNLGDRLGLRIQKRSFLSSLTVPSIADIHPPISSSYRKQQGEIQLTLVGQKTASPLGGGNTLELQTAFEKPILRPVENAILQSNRPALAWFTLDPLLDNFNGKVALTVSNTSGELAPLWQVQALNWPARVTGSNPIQDPARYHLQGYWIPEALTPAHSIKIPRLRDLRSSQFTPMSPPEVTIQEIVIRDNTKVPGGTWLYVRCTHQPGQSVLFQLRSAAVFSGFTEEQIPEEHRYFPESNSVSAWFDVSKIIEQDREFSLDLYSLTTVLRGDNTTRLEYEAANPAEYLDLLKDRRWRDRADRRGASR